MMPFKVIRQLFSANIQKDVRTFVNQGGTSSGKTYTLMQVLIYFAIHDAGCVITVVGQDLPNLKVGAWRDAETIIARSEWLQKFFTTNYSSHTLRGFNGSIIEFKSYKDAQSIGSYLSAQGRRCISIITLLKGFGHIMRL